MGDDTRKKQNGVEWISICGFCLRVGHGNTEVEKPAYYTISDLKQQQNNTDVFLDLHEDDILWLQNNGHSELSGKGSVKEALLWFDFLFTKLETSRQIEQKSNINKSGSECIMNDHYIIYCLSEAKRFKDDHLNFLF